MQMKKRVCFSGVTTTLLMMFSFAAQASPITLQPIYNNNYYIYAYGDGFSSTQSRPRLNFKDRQFHRPCKSTGVSHWNSGRRDQPLSEIAATSSATGIGTSAISGSLSYQFRIEDASGVWDPANQLFVPTIVSYKGSVSTTIPSNSGATSYFNIAGTDFSESYQVVTGAFPSATHELNGFPDPTFSGTSFDERKTYSIIANTFNRIDILATATVTHDGYTTAFIDPFIQIDPNFVDADKYHIVLSPGIDNFVARVPLPAALLMFSTGLLGLVGFARRKKASLE